MTIITDTFIPYEYDDKHDVLKYVESRAHGIKMSLRLVERDSEYLLIRCPLSGDYITVSGTEDEIYWLHKELEKRKWYRINS